MITSVAAGLVLVALAVAAGVAVVWAADWAAKHGQHRFFRWYWHHIGGEGDPPEPYRPIPPSEWDHHGPI